MFSEGSHRFQPSSHRSSLGMDCGMVQERRELVPIHDDAARRRADAAGRLHEVDGKRAAPRP